MKKDLVHTTKQGSLFTGFNDPKLIKDALKRNSTLYTTKKGKDRSLLGYIKQIAKEKQRERPEEQENKENGGTQYWSTFRS